MPSGCPWEEANGRCGSWRRGTRKPPPLPASLDASQQAGGASHAGRIVAGDGAPAAPRRAPGRGPGAGPGVRGRRARGPNPRSVATCSCAPSGYDMSSPRRTETRAIAPTDEQKQSLYFPGGHAARESRPRPTASTALSPGCVQRAWSIARNEIRTFPRRTGSGQSPRDPASPVRVRRMRSARTATVPPGPARWRSSASHARRARCWSSFAASSTGTRRGSSDGRRGFSSSGALSASGGAPSCLASAPTSSPARQRCSARSSQARAGGSCRSRRRGIRAASHGMRGRRRRTWRTWRQSNWRRMVSSSKARPMFAATMATMKSQCELSLTTVGEKPLRRTRLHDVPVERELGPVQTEASRGGAGQGGACGRAASGCVGWSTTLSSSRTNRSSWRRPPRPSGAPPRPRRARGS